MISIRLIRKYSGYSVNLDSLIRNDYFIVFISSITQLVAV